MSRDPALIEIEALATRNAELNTEYRFSDLPRIAPLLLRDAGTARVQLRFGYEMVGERRRPVAEGEVSAKPVVACQRCLGPVEVSMRAECQLVFVASDDEAEGVPDSYDAVLMNEGRVSLVDLVEEELLLGLPLIAMHDAAVGCIPRSEAPVAVMDGPKGAPTQRPFAGLRDLIKRSE